jgi:virulence factor Mce-like protein
VKRAAVVIALLAVLVSGCGTSDGRYKVVAIFDNASFLIPGQDVRIAGANVGTVTSVSVTPDQKARIEMSVDKRFAPFRSDADCFIAPQSLIGERFIQCAPGTTRGAPLKGDPPVVALSQTHAPVDPDLVAATFTLPVRQRLSIILNELGAGLAGNGEALSGAIRRANPAIQATQDVLRIVDRDRAVLGRLVDRSDEVIGQLARRRDRVGAFIQQAADVAQTAARRDGAISEGIRRLPSTLDQTRASLAALGTLADRSRPLLGDLQQSARPLNRLVSDTPALAGAARPALRHLAAMSRTGTGTLRDGAPVVKKLRAFAKVGVPAGNLVTQLNESLRDRGVVEGIQSFVYTAALAISRYDQVSHLLPSYLVSPAACLTFASTTTPDCDAHLSKGSADARARTRSHTTRRHTKARHHRRAAAHHDAGPSAPSAPSGGGHQPSNPVAGVVDTAKGIVGQLTQSPPPLPKVPALPSPPAAPPVQVPGHQNDLLDYLLGS